MKKILISILVGLVLIFGVLGFLLYPTYTHLFKMTRIEIDPELTVFKGGGGNSLVLRSEDGKDVLLVDTKMASGSTALREYIDSLGKGIHLTVVNTHDHPDHAGGNPLFPEAHLIAGAYTDETWKRDVEDRLPDERIPAGEEKTLSIGNETVVIHNMGQAHTTNDMVVYLKNRKFLMTGDLVFLDMHPVLRSDSGARVKNWIEVLEDLQNRFEIRTLLPGHGPISDRGALTTMMDYFTSIRDARDNPEKLEELKKRYRDYYSLPFSSSFEKTVEYIRAEWSGNQP